MRNALHIRPASLSEIFLPSYLYGSLLTSSKSFLVCHLSSIYPDHPVYTLILYISEKKPTNMLIQKDTCTRMFIAALFIIARTWTQPKCPSTDEWLKEMWYIYTMEYYSTIKKNEILPLAETWMDLEGILLSEISQTEKDKYYMISLICGI